MHIDQNKNKGFTLVELVIVVAILAILVGILAPAYSKYVERSAESTDLENVRTAYGEVMIAVEIEEEKDVLKVVPLKLKKSRMAVIKYSVNCRNLSFQWRSGYRSLER